MRNRIRGLGMSTEDLGSKLKLVAGAVSAGATALENPQAAAAALQQQQQPQAVSVKIPYVPIVLGVLAVGALYFLMKKK